MIQLVNYDVIFSFRYFYRLLSGPELLSSFEKDRAWHVLEDLDLLAMEVGLLGLNKLCFK